MKQPERNITRTWLRVRIAACSVTAIGTLLSFPAMAQEQTRVVCIGEQTTHSAHRENDPEYPFLMGPVLDDDFVADADQHPDSGGFLYGGGTNFRIANLGVPKGSVLNAETGDAKPVIGRNEVNLASDFDADVVILGPFGSHEALTNRSMDNFTADLVQLIERIEGFDSQPEVLIALPLPHGADNGGSNGPIYQQVYDDSAAVAADRGMGTIDLWSPFIGQSQFYNDATHLSEVGRQELADVVGATVKQWVDDQATTGVGGAGNMAMAGSGAFAGSGAGGAALSGGAGGLGNLGGALNPGGAGGAGVAVSTGGASDSVVAGGASAGGAGNGGSGTGVTPMLASGGQATSGGAPPTFGGAAPTSGTASSDATGVTATNPVTTDTTNPTVVATGTTLVASDAANTMNTMNTMNSAAQPSTAQPSTAQPSATSSTGCAMNSTTAPRSGQFWLMALALALPWLRRRR